MYSYDDAFSGVFYGLKEPFDGINEVDMEVHGIYIDHLLEEEFFTPPIEVFA